MFFAVLPDGFSLSVENFVEDYDDYVICKHYKRNKTPHTYNGLIERK